MEWTKCFDIKLKITDVFRMSHIVYIDESGVLDRMDRYFVITGVLTNNKSARRHLKSRVKVKKFVAALELLSGLM